MNSLIAKIRDVSPQTLSAMKKIDRINFIPEKQKISRQRAYEDTALSIGYDVTISQPSLVGKMIDLLELDSINHVLELGTGSAYNAAIISELIPYGHLTTVERVKCLAKRAKKILEYNDNVSVKEGDASSIKYKHKFDRIIVTAEFLDRDMVLNFIKNNAAHFCIIVFPYQGILWKVVKCGDKIDWNKMLSVRFVPVLKGMK